MALTDGELLVAAAVIGMASAWLSSTISYSAVLHRSQSESRMKILELEYNRIQSVVSEVLQVEADLVDGTSWPIVGIQAKEMASRIHSLRQHLFWFIGNPNAIQGLRDFANLADQFLELQAKHVKPDLVTGPAMPVVKEMIEASQRFQVGARQQLVPWRIGKGSKRQLKAERKRIGF